MVGVSVRMVGEIIAAHPKRAAVRHGLVGIDDQVRHHLADLARIDFRRPQIGAEQELASAVRAAQREADRVLDEFADRRGLLNRRAAAGEGQELLRQITRAQRGVLRVVQPRRHLVVRREEQGSEGDVSDDRGEQVVEIVRNPAGEQAELFQGLGFASLGFVALTLGDVAENQHHAGDFIFAVANRGGDLLDDVFGPFARPQGRVLRHG